ncbi:MAG TPA: (2Fe-2S) ferredoxin domain-containing protein [Terriglobia bacterium]|nr:(2Fe-2S) ferredoxin domain-containing protein [Terriglobia bacterium]
MADDSKLEQSSGQTAAPAQAVEDKRYVFVCMNVDCRTKGATPLMERLQARLQQDSDPSLKNVEVRPYMCFGGCHDGPNVVIYPDKVWYAGVHQQDADAIVDQHLKKGELVKPLSGKIDQGLQDMIYQLLDSGIF